MKKDSWDSEFRKKRFYENQRQKVLKENIKNEMLSNPINNYLMENQHVFAIPRSIAIMLDLEGTCNKITDEEAEIFMKQVDTLRKQFGDKTAYICISTHSSSSTHVKSVLDILSKYANENIVFDASFIYGGMYSYKNDSVTPMGFFYNSDKIQTFTEYYLYNLNVGWFALIDDKLRDDVYQSFQHIIPMVGLKPSGKKEEYYNNFMYRTTDTNNFSGVIELLDEYIKNIKGMTLDRILMEQSKMSRHLSSWELYELLINNEFKEVIDYLNSGKSDIDDFNNTYKAIKDYPVSILEKYKEDIIKIFLILERSKLFSEQIEDIKKLLFS